VKSGVRSPRSEPRLLAFVALGSNLGDSASVLRQALVRLQEWSEAPLLCSSLWRTAPIDCPPDSPPFINAVAGLQPCPSATPESLLDRLQQVEREFGRRPKLQLNEPRPLDLDLLAFGSERRTSDRLVLPHPRAHLRRFVLAPWAEIAPDLVIPGRRQTVRRLLALLPPAVDVERFEP
jgi:2-amino-4-hydroxy-6-hydroxymethyldihydropteridine diphosphokinase